jgi:putative transposase
MPKKGHSEEQILRALAKRNPAPRSAKSVASMESADATFYIWKKNYSGLGLSELRELRQLREENGKLKRRSRKVYKMEHFRRLVKGLDLYCTHRAGFFTEISGRRNRRYRGRQAGLPPAATGRRLRDHSGRSAQSRSSRSHS